MKEHMKRPLKRLQGLSTFVFVCLLATTILTACSFQNQGQGNDIHIRLQ